jgi:ribulose-bisphosphate carboxylase large chain
MFFVTYDDARTRGKIGGKRFSVAYRLYGDEKAARGMAEDICAEQTVEFPVRLLPPGAIPKDLAGRVEKFEKEDGGRYLVTVSFAEETASGEFTQFLNVVFGNVSLKRGIQVARICPDGAVPAFLPGPRHGVGGIRELVGVFGRPLLFTAL